jgi:hypothetical protein
MGGTLSTGSVWHELGIPALQARIRSGFVKLNEYRVTSLPLAIQPGFEDQPRRD